MAKKKKSSLGMRILNHTFGQVQKGLPGKSSPAIQDIGCVIAGAPKASYQAVTIAGDATVWLYRKAKRLYHKIR